jgi:hypothetical protein
MIIIHHRSLVNDSPSQPEANVHHDEHNGNSDAHTDDQQRLEIACQNKNSTTKRATRSKK